MSERELVDLIIRAERMSAAQTGSAPAFSLGFEPPCPQGSAQQPHAERTRDGRLLTGVHFIVDATWWLYRVTLAPLFGPCCRFAPSCSVYGREAVRRYGLARGGWMALKRILRCHPLHPGGWDPVV